ncbi:MAG: hypothetical protein ACI9ES_000671 [Oceanospirillaceae bacterium]|jgi:uncharacterized protein (TIGR02444 family)
MLDDNALWQFAKHFYAAPGIATQLLELQNKYALNINQLIFAIWLVTQNHQLMSLPNVASESEQWRCDIVMPLRNLRFNIKQKMSCADGATVKSAIEATQLIEACYQQLLKAELAAEKVELSYLYHHRSEFYQLKPQYQPRGSAELVSKNLNVCWDLCLVKNSESEFKEQAHTFSEAVISWLQE